jgi:acyl carrier protein
MELAMNSIETRLTDILLDELNVERDPKMVLASDSLRQDLGLDSLGFIELRNQVETSFGISISDDEFTPENFSNISSLSDLIRRRSAH